MTLIDTGFDPLLNSNYELYSMKLFGLKELANSWYKDIDLSKFDNRFVRERDENSLTLMKKAGIVCNFFFALREDDKYYLMDGYNRLFTDYGKINEDCVVYLKVLTDKISDHGLITNMLQLNLWKLYRSRVSYGGFSIDDFLDRGFRLFLFKKFGIEFYECTNENYYTRLRNESDINVIDYYFRNEYESCGDFKTNYEGVFRILNNPNVINDFKEIIKANDYLKEPFNNYCRFLYGFVMFVAERRLRGDDKRYEFKTFLDKLYEDKKFFKKLQGMAWTDSTRKNIYKFFRELPLDKI